MYSHTQLLHSNKIIKKKMMHVNIHLPKWQYSFSDMVPGIWLAKIIAYFFLQKFRPNNQSMAKAKQNNKLKTKNI